MNAGKYNKKITIVKSEYTASPDDFLSENNPTNFKLVLQTWASVKTTKGFTLISSGSDFESATTNFTIRFPKVEIDRRMHVLFNGKVYSIKYLNNVNEDNVELEMQCQEVTQ